MVLPVRYFFRRKCRGLRFLGSGIIAQVISCAREFIVYLHRFAAYNHYSNTSSDLCFTGHSHTRVSRPSCPLGRLRQLAKARRDLVARRVEVPAMQAVNGMRKAPEAVGELPKEVQVVGGRVPVG